MKDELVYNRNMIRYGSDPLWLSDRRGSVRIKMNKGQSLSGQFVPLCRYFDYVFGNKGEWDILWQ